jgi:hypothetical protein
MMDEAEIEHVSDREVPSSESGSGRRTEALGGLPSRSSVPGAENGGSVNSGLPAFVEQEFRDFLTCGVLAHGFARLRCTECAFERLVPS